MAMGVVLASTMVHAADIDQLVQKHGDAGVELADQIWRFAALG